jgi:hypothetical protein
MTKRLLPPLRRPIRAIKIKRLPAGLSSPPSRSQHHNRPPAANRNASDWTMRLAAITANAELITIDGEAVVVGPDGLSRFEELSRRVHR